jgi:6-phosphogluconate dehydrogenase
MSDAQPSIGLFGLAVMGQNLALNIASKGFAISVCNRSPGKVSSVHASVRMHGAYVPLHDMAGNA